MDNLPHGPFLIARLELDLGHPGHKLAQPSRQLLDLIDQLTAAIDSNRKLADIRASGELRWGHRPTQAVVLWPFYVEGLAAGGADDTDSRDRVRAQQPIGITLRKTPNVLFRLLCAACGLAFQYRLQLRHQLAGLIKPLLHHLNLEKL